MDQKPESSAGKDDFVEDSETVMPRADAKRLLESWPKPRGVPLANPFLPKIELRLRAEWKQTGRSLFYYEFKVTSRRFFFGDSMPVPLETLKLHWMFDPGVGTVKVGRRTKENAQEIEKSWIFDQELYRALAWAEGWHKNKYYRSFLAALA